MLSIISQQTYTGSFALSQPEEGYAELAACYKCRTDETGPLSHVMRLS